MTQYQKTRKELGTITYSRLVKPNILDDYTLYLKDLTEMEELDKTKENLIVDRQPKNIDLTKKNSIFDLLENKDKNKEKDEKVDDKEEDEKKENKEEKKDNDVDKNKEDDKNEKDEEKEKEKETDEIGDNDKTGGKKLLKITVSTEPDNKSNKLML